MTLRIAVIYEHSSTSLLISRLLATNTSYHYSLRLLNCQSDPLDCLFEPNHWDICVAEETALQALSEAATIRLVNQLPVILLKSGDNRHFDLTASFADILHIDKLSSELLERSFLFINAQKKHRRQLKALTLYDPLTQLPNRSFFQSRLSTTIAQNARQRKSFAILLIDLDRFKLINHSFGHERGDQYLIQASQLIKKNLRQNDIAARLGNDEFAIILNTENASQMAERLIQAFNEPFVINEREIRIHASIGIATFPRDGNNNSQLMKAANSAMINVKQRGGGALRFYEASQQQAVDQSWIESEFYNAFNSGQLFLHYQPQVSASSGECIALEALCRWYHPEQGLIPPSVFIPAIEKTPMIIDLGQWVLESVCKELAELQHLGKQIKIAVNISMMHICHSHFVEEIYHILALTGAESNRLELELTESALMVDPLQSIGTLSELRDLGIGISIDDFGTGHSSLAYLVDLPIDTLKIDRSFVTELTRNKKRESVIRAIIALAKSLNLATVAEGVEDKQTAEELMTLGCDYLQGYYFGKPALLSELLQSNAISIERG